MLAIQLIAIHGDKTGLKVARGHAEFRAVLAKRAMVLRALELAIQMDNSIKTVVVVHLQNPLGSIMPDAHKQRLVQLCQTSAITLIEDDDR